MPEKNKESTKHDSNNLKGQKHNRSNGLSQPKPQQEGVDFLELLRILKRHRFMIGLVTLLMFFLAALYCLLATPKYEIVAQVQSGITSFGQNSVPIRDISPDVIVNLLSRQNLSGVSSGKKKKGGTPAFLLNVTATTKRKSKIILVRALYPDPNKGKELLQKLLDRLATNLEKNMKARLDITRRQIIGQRRNLELELEKINIEGAKIAGEIKQKRQELMTAKTELQTIRKNRNQTEKVKKRISQQMEKVYQNTNELMNLRKSLIKDNTDKFSILMYTNIFQQNISYITSLEQRLAQIEREINGYMVKEAKKKEDIAGIEINIHELEAKKDRELPMAKKAIESKIKIIDARAAALSPLETVQPPTASMKPVSPRKKSILILSLITGLLLGILLAFIREAAARLKENAASQ